MLIGAVHNVTCVSNVSTSHTIHDLQGTTLDLPRFHGFLALDYMFARKAQLHCSPLTMCKVNMHLPATEFVMNCSKSSLAVTILQFFSV
jgi:hypothetical protein